MTRLRLAELNVQLDGTWWPETFNTKKVMNVFMARVSYVNYYNNL
jgi:hypothetical protein